MNLTMLIIIRTITMKMNFKWWNDNNKTIWWRIRQRQQLLYLTKPNKMGTTYLISKFIIYLWRQQKCKESHGDMKNRQYVHLRGHISITNLLDYKYEIHFANQLSSQNELTFYFDIFTYLMLFFNSRPYCQSTLIHTQFHEHALRGPSENGHIIYP